MSVSKVVDGAAKASPAGRAQTSFQPRVQPSPGLRKRDISRRGDSRSRRRPRGLVRSLFLYALSLVFFLAYWCFCIAGFIAVDLYIVPCELDSTAPLPLSPPSNKDWWDMSTRAVVLSASNSTQYPISCH